MCLGQRPPLRVIWADFLCYLCAVGELPTASSLFGSTSVLWGGEPSERQLVLRIVEWTGVRS